MAGLLSSPQPKYGLLADQMDHGLQQGLLQSRMGSANALQDYLRRVMTGQIASEATNRYADMVMRAHRGDQQAIGEAMAELMPGPDLPIGGLLGTVAKKSAKAAKALPMDEASRILRARKQGFDVDAYHGTNQDIMSFANEKRGSVTRAKSAKEAHWFVDNPETASGYAELAGSNEVQKLIDASQLAERRGQWDKAHDLMAKAEKLEMAGGFGENVMPVKLRGNFMEYDAGGRWMQDLDESQLSTLVQEAKKKGYDGLKITNFSDEAAYGMGRPATHYAVFEPWDIRSRFARFDPKKDGSSNILAGAAGLGLLPFLFDKDEQR